MWPGAGWPWREGKVEKIGQELQVLQNLVPFWGRPKRIYINCGPVNVDVSRKAEQSCNFQPVFKSTFIWRLEEDVALCKMILFHTHTHTDTNINVLFFDVLLFRIVVYPALLSGGFCQFAKYFCSVVVLQAVETKRTSQITAILQRGK